MLGDTTVICLTYNSSPLHNTVDHNFIYVLYQASLKVNIVKYLWKYLYTKINICHIGVFLIILTNTQQSCVLASVARQIPYVLYISPLCPLQNIVSSSSPKVPVVRWLTAFLANVVFFFMIFHMLINRGFSHRLCAHSLRYSLVARSGTLLKHLKYLHFPYRGPITVHTSEYIKTI